MAVYRCEIKTIGRAAGRSAVAAAAYRSASRGTNQRDGVTHDYRRRSRGVVHTDVLTPDHAPDWALERERLWNAAEAAENRRNSVTAREVIISLPHELDDQQRADLVRGFAAGLVNRYGVAVDLSIHRPDPQGDNRNHHAHVMMTTRRLSAEGFTEKTRELDDQTKPKDGGRPRGPLEVEAIRELWEREQNNALSRAGVPERVTRKSLAERGIDREPQPKIGEAANALQRRGEPAQLAERCKEVIDRNAAKEAARAAEMLRQEREEEQRRITMREHMARQQREKQEAEKREAQKSADLARALESAAKMPDIVPLSPAQRQQRLTTWLEFHRRQRREMTRMDATHQQQASLLRVAHEREIQPSEPERGSLRQAWNKFTGQADKDASQARERTALQERQHERERREQQENQRIEKERMRSWFESERQRVARDLKENERLAGRSANENGQSERREGQGNQWIEKERLRPASESGQRAAPDLKDVDRVDNRSTNENRQAERERRQRERERDRGRGWEF